MTREEDSFTNCRKKFKSGTHGTIFCANMAWVKNQRAGNRSLFYAEENDAKNRVQKMAEIAPKYCDVIIERWENYTGEKVVLL